MQDDTQDKLSSIPGVTSAAFGSAMPLEEFGLNLGVLNRVDGAASGFVAIYDGVSYTVSQ